VRPCRSAAWSSSLLKKDPTTSIQSGSEWPPVGPVITSIFLLLVDEETIEDFARRDQSADISIIEGNKGLYDGLDLDGSNSNAALAKSLQAPVILVIDARGTMRGIAPC